MAGGGSNHKPSSHTKPPPPSSSSSSAAAVAPNRKSRWGPPSSSAAATATVAAVSNAPVSAGPKPKPKPNPNPKPASSPKPNPSPTLAAHQHRHNHHPVPPPPPPPTYGFHMLERRTIALADGSVRTYWALPPDYQDFPPVPRFFSGGPLMGPVSPAGPSRHPDYWNSLGLDAPGAAAGKRKFSDEEDKDRRRREGKEEERGQLGRFGNPNGEDSRALKYMRTSNGGFGGGIGGGDRHQSVVATKHSEVDQGELKKAFLRFAKTVNENANQRKNYLENGKHGRLRCAACDRSSKDFPDTHSLIMHCYNSDSTDLCVDHLGLHKALCALMGWNYLVPPDNSKAYQHLSAEEAAANQDDLIMWPPMVIIHNTITGKNKDGRLEGLGNKIMDTKIRDLGFPAGKSKSLYGREGHLGITLIKFSSDQAGLKEAKRMADYFERDNRGRKAWSRLQPLTLGGKDDENNPHLMKLDEKTREKKRIFYGYLLSASDIDKVDFDTRKKVTIESHREYRSS